MNIDLDRLSAALKASGLDEWTGRGEELVQEVKNIQELDAEPLGDQHLMDFHDHHGSVGFDADLLIARQFGSWVAHQARFIPWPPNAGGDIDPLLMVIDSVYDLPPETTVEQKVALAEAVRRAGERITEALGDPLLTSFGLACRDDGAAHPRKDLQELDLVVAAVYRVMYPEGQNTGISGRRVKKPMKLVIAAIGEASERSWPERQIDSRIDLFLDKMPTGLINDKSFRPLTPVDVHPSLFAYDAFDKIHTRSKGLSGRLISLLKRSGAVFRRHTKL